MNFNDLWILPQRKKMALLYSPNQVLCEYFLRWFIKSTPFYILVLTPMVCLLLFLLPAFSRVSHALSLMSCTGTKFHCTARLDTLSLLISYDLIPNQIFWGVLARNCLSLQVQFWVKWRPVFDGWPTAVFAWTQTDVKYFIFMRGKIVFTACSYRRLCQISRHVTHTDAFNWSSLWHSLFFLFPAYSLHFSYLFSCMRLISAYRCLTKNTFILRGICLCTFPDVSQCHLPIGLSPRLTSRLMSFL